jgi:hypothetical protein
VPHDERASFDRLVQEASIPSLDGRRVLPHQHIIALVAARTLTGADGFTVNALPHDRLREVLKKYNRLR